MVDDEYPRYTMNSYKNKWFNLTSTGRRWLGSQGSAGSEGIRSSIPTTTESTDDFLTNHPNVSTRPSINRLIRHNGVCNIRWPTNVWYDAWGGGAIQSKRGPVRDKLVPISSVYITAARAQQYL
ncbi:hypothetical protein EVAR_4557_1 [Eumeta japonica]|uniref:Uncharacterized protein n=1 Tax=Eumeta variegata TaxID=151549 RepID=A0A4C1SW52_EUMVA|nr:hypothetical protein EVAR_4557_1 [Eumeta japonica]